MCRFLLITSKQPINVQTVLAQFADMAEKSRAPDGDRQADGWGAAWYTDGWQVKKSIRPMWEDREKFQEIPETTFLALHARSASFPAHKDTIEYNQPFTQGTTCFVFNGSIQGIKMAQPVPGTIGAQKLFYLLQKNLKHLSPEDSLRQLDTLIQQSSVRIEGMNIGIIHNGNMYALCEYADNEQYFGLRYFQNEDAAFLCSEPFGSYPWKTMKKGEVISL